MLALTMVVVAGSTGYARGAVTPYRRWSFDLQRALANQDSKTVRELVGAQPGFARVSFYGEIFDLVSATLRERMRVAVQERLVALSGALVAHEPDAQRWMGRIDAEPFAQHAHRAIETSSQARRLADDRQLDAVALLTIEHADLARALFHGALFNSALAETRLGGVTDRDRWMRVARWMAVGLALGFDDYGPWRTLAAWSDQPTVPSRNDGLKDAEITDALNLAITGQLGPARARLDATQRSLLSIRGPSLFGVLMFNGVASLSSRLGQHDVARAERVQVLQAVRPLGRRNLTALVLERMVDDHLSDAATGGISPFSSELRGLEPASLAIPRLLETLGRAARILRESADGRGKQGDFATARRQYTEALSILELLRQPKALAVTESAGTLAPAREALLHRMASVHLSMGKLAFRVGRFDEAQTSLLSAQSLYAERLDLAVEAARTDTALAQVALATGTLNKALALTDRAAARLLAPNLYPAAPVERARQLWVAGQIHQRRGDYPRAIASANAAITVMHEAGVADTQPKLVAALHRLAALGLHAVGIGSGAAHRLQASMRAQPSIETARLLALLHIDAGRSDAAVEALTGNIPDHVEGQSIALPMPEGDSRFVALVYRGCAQVHAKRPKLAIVDLAAVARLMGPEHRRAQIVGRLCLAAAHLRLGQAEEANVSLAPARALVLSHPVPALSWRLHATDGAIAAARADWIACATSLRQAVASWIIDSAHRSLITPTLDMLTLAPPSSLRRFTDILTLALTEAADLDRDNADTYRIAALRYAVWARHDAARAPTTARIGRDMTTATTDRLRRIGAEAEGFERVLRETAVAPAQRAAASAGLVGVLGRQRGAIDTLRRDHSVWASHSAIGPLPAAAFEPPPGEARLYYAIGETRGHAWLYPPGARRPHYAALPGRLEISDRLEAARKVIKTPPPAIDTEHSEAQYAAIWRTLAEPVPMILPFVRQPKILRQMEGARLHVLLDDPLVQFPLGALVLEPPPSGRPDHPPAYLATRWHLTTALLARPISRDPSGDLTVIVDQRTPGQYAFLGPDPGALAECPVSATGVGHSCDACSLLQSWLGRAAAPLSTCPQPDSQSVSSMPIPPRGRHAAAATGTKHAFAHALTTYTNVHVIAPIDVRDGSIGLCDGAKATPADLAELDPAPQTLILSHFDRPGPRQPIAHGLRRIVNAARFAGAERIVLWVEPGEADADCETIAALANRIANVDGVDLAEWRRQVAASHGEPGLGRPPPHHPYYWARWMVFDNLGATFKATGTSDSSRPQ